MNRKAQLSNMLYLIGELLIGIAILIFIFYLITKASGSANADNQVLDNFYNKFDELRKTDPGNAESILLKLKADTTFLVLSKFGSQSNPEYAKGVTECENKGCMCICKNKDCTQKKNRYCLTIENDVFIVGVDDQGNPTPAGISFDGPHSVRIEKGKGNVVGLCLGTGENCLTSMQNKLEDVCRKRPDATSCLYNSNYFYNCVPTVVGENGPLNVQIQGGQLVGAECANCYSSNVFSCSNIARTVCEFAAQKQKICGLSCVYDKDKGCMTNCASYDSFAACSNDQANCEWSGNPITGKCQNRPS